MLVPSTLAVWLGVAFAAETFSDYTFYYGDLHAHTGYSGDGGSADMGNCKGSCGNFADVFTTAKSNGLDFVALTDHINGTTTVGPTEFLELHAAVLAANDEAGGFITIPAGEIYFTEQGSSNFFGHKTMLLFGDNSELADLEISDLRTANTSEMRSCEAIWELMEKVDRVAGGAMIIPHHPAVQRPMYNNWSCFNATWEPAVEVYSEHGSSMDDGGYDVPGVGLVPAATVHEALSPSGYNLMFGFIGGTDSHDTRPGAVCTIDTEHPSHLYAGGLTVVVLSPDEAFTRDAIQSAIVARSTYVTTGPQLPLTLSWTAKGAVMGGLGDAVSVPEDGDLDAEVSFPADRATYVLSVELVGPDARWPLVEVAAGRWTGAVPPEELPEWLYVAVEIDGASWYGGVGACADGGDDQEWIWLSPSPLSTFDDDLDDDGRSVLVDDCDDADPSVYGGAAERWYDGVDQDCAGDNDYDQDADGHVAALYGGDDCDDTRADVYPDAPEIPDDGVIQDCVLRLAYDKDNDGHLSTAGGGGDCDDGDAEISPDATERWYDGVDQDCDGASDFDADMDRHEALVWGGDDCDDADPTISPSATETYYDGVDQNCDGRSDDDQDHDGLPVDDDCDDEDATIGVCEDPPDDKRCATTPERASTLLLFAALGLARRRAVVGGRAG